ncbi:MAG: chorismate synthase [Flavobacteriaceae bacterium]|nr:chorismate synthase [Flavobacteriaceae bacterium]
MPGNTFGSFFKLTTFGESHGVAIGGIIDGCPAGIQLNLEAIQQELDRRRPGQSAIVTQRKEADEVIFLSGIFEGVTTGTPIAFEIKNQDAKSKDYSHIKDVYRPSHADFTYQKKYGHRDYRGGGRSSARETASRVVAGALAKQVLKNISFHAFTYSVGELSLKKTVEEIDFSLTEKSITRCPDPKLASKMEAYIKNVRKQGDTVGGVVACVIKNVPVGLGEPVFDKLHAELGKAMLSINAVKGFEIGSGFEGTKMLGSEHNDKIKKDETTNSNFSGGVQGGISNGMPIYFKVAFKPVATLMQDQKSIDIHQQEANVKGKGRHDPCVVPRAVPIVEAMAALVILDQLLLHQARKEFNL